MAEISKLQIRAKVLSVISEIKTINTFNETLLNKYVDELSDIQDRKALFDIFIKEYLKLNENEYIFSALCVKELISKEYIEEKVFELIKSTSLSDELKYKLVQLLRIVGCNCDFTELPQYFDNPNEVLDKETQRLLDAATFNPESVLDFLDFVSAVSYNDRSLLLKSLKLDYQGDVLANIVYPILYSDFEDDFVLDVVKLLSDSKSSLAIAPFNYLIQTSSNINIVNACKMGLKKLKLSGAKQELAEEYFKNMIEKSIPAEFFTTIPDGKGNQALLISRCNNADKYLLAAIVINDIQGIIDCFGFFNITQEEIIKILTKFYKSEGKYKVSPSYIKMRIDIAVQKTIQNKMRFPYEFICWSPLISDIEPLSFDLKDYSNKNCKLQTCSKDTILTLLTQEYTLRWFITPDENRELKSIVDNLYSSSDINVDDLNNYIKDNIDNILDEKTLSIWKDRIYNLIYLLRNNDKLKEADIFYTMLNNENFFNLFKQIIVQRSIFSYFVGTKENIKDSIFTTNIFLKKKSDEQKLDSKKIDKIIDKLTKSWLNG